MGGKTDCVEALLKAGAAHTAKNGDGSTPLHHACYAEVENGKTIALLLSHGADVNATDNNDGTPLMIAAKRNQVEGTECLLQQKAKTSLVDTVCCPLIQRIYRKRITCFFSMEKMLYIMRSIRIMTKSLNC